MAGFLWTDKNVSVVQHHVVTNTVNIVFFSSVVLYLQVEERMFAI